MSGSYAHKDDEKEVDRQEALLNKGDFNRKTLDFLIESVGGAENLIGKNIADLGCGNGDLTCELAKLVGPTGLVVAIDSNAEQLAHLEGLKSRMALDQIVIIRGSVADLPSLLAANGVKKLDGVHNRFLLTHLTPDFKAMIFQYVLTLLNPGGFYMVGEGVLSRSMGVDPFVDRWVAACHLASKLLSVDYDYGLKLLEDLTRFGFEGFRQSEIEDSSKSTRLAKEGLCIDYGDVINILERDGLTLESKDSDLAKSLCDDYKTEDFKKRADDFCKDSNRGFSLVGRFVFAYAIKRAN